MNTMIPEDITLDNSADVVFHNNVGFCVGTGRMRLALGAEYQEELALVQREIGFSHIRGHGLFCDDMSIYHVYEEDGRRQVEYNFTYLDEIMDRYRELGIAPFLELGFMPSEASGGDQTIFYWKGNTCPPRDYDDWAALIRATLTHLLDRYGERALTWPIEVWNEPNLAGFWKDADMQEYFKLFKVSFNAVKSVDRRFAVGGPAICGVNPEVWMREFLNFCKTEGIRPDFITRHHYTIDVPQYVGDAGYVKTADPSTCMDVLTASRATIDSFTEYAGLPMHITEFSTSYNPRTPIHDTNYNAAYIAGMLARFGETSESYSYWTFGDVFEETGVPLAEFHGGFGLVARGCVPKPTFWTFAFFKRLQEYAEAGAHCILKSDRLVVLERDGSYRGVCWNLSDDTICTKLHIAARIEHSAVTKTVDPACCNPLKAWHDLGEPRIPTKEQLALLRECAQPKVRTEIISDGTYEITLRKDGIMYFTIEPRHAQGYRGFDYDRAILRNGMMD